MFLNSFSDLLSYFDRGDPCGGAGTGGKGRTMGVGHARCLAKVVEDVLNWVPKHLTLGGKQSGAGNDFHVNPCRS
jgi:hypothetical protein